MLSSPYPVPPSRAWTAAMSIQYAAFSLAGVLVLVLMILLPQTREGVVTLALWGGTTGPAGAVAFIGVLRSKYRFEWIASWFIVMGTAVYTSVTIVNTLMLGLVTLVISLPTILAFWALVAGVLARAIQLSRIDMQARRQVLAVQAVTGEIPEVADE